MNPPILRISVKHCIFQTVPEQQERAFNLGLASLLGDKVFNFGELVRFRRMFFLLYVRNR